MTCTILSIEDQPKPAGIKVRKAVYGPKLTLAIVRELLARVGVTIRSGNGELRVNLKGASEDSASYQNDLDDALATGRAMAHHAERQEETTMIYGSKERAEQVAAELNQRRGHPTARVFRAPQGWIVIASWTF